MLEALKKKLGIVADKEGSGLAVNLTETGAEAIATLTQATEVALNDLAAAEALMTEQSQEIAALTEQLATATTALATAQALVAEVEAGKQAALAEAKAAKMEARKAVVVGVIGEAKAEAFLTATENLDDAAFEAVSSALAGGAAAEASSALFKEVGVDGTVDATKVVEESAEMKLLKQKYPQGTGAK